jgi:arylsulfatase
MLLLFQRSSGVPLILALCSLFCAWSVQARSPSIVLVMADDVGYGDLACLGNPIVRTPSIDGFYKESVRFTNFHVSPTSSATRAALLTGRHEFHGGVTHTGQERERLRRDAVTLAQVLKSAGYATGVFGKWHLGDEDAYQPDRRGFEETFIHGGSVIGQAPSGSSGDVPGNTHFDPRLWHNGEFMETLGYSTDVIFRHAVEWMDDQIDAGKPYFALILPSAAQPPVCPPEYERFYLRQKVAAELAPFFGMVSNLDDNFGQVLAKLREWGSEENTVVIFLTDHGGSFGVKTFNADMRGGAATPYEGGTRVPSFWRWSSHWKPGADVAALTAHLDLLPTLARIAGAEVPADVTAKLEGRDLQPLLEQPSREWPDRILFTHIGGWEHGQAEQSEYVGSAVRDSRFSLVNNTELYDLPGDHAQARNVFNEHHEEVQKLRTAYEQWWKEIQPGLVNEDAVPPKTNPFVERWRKQSATDPAKASPDLK